MELRSGTREEIRESQSPEQRSDRKLRPAASRSLWTVRDKRRRITGRKNITGIIIPEIFMYSSSRAPLMCIARCTALNHLQLTAAHMDYMDLLLQLT